MDFLKQSQNNTAFCFLLFSVLYDFTKMCMLSIKKRTYVIKSVSPG